MEATTFRGLCDEHRDLPEGCKLIDKRVRILGHVLSVRTATQVFHAIAFSDYHESRFDS